MAPTPGGSSHATSLGLTWNGTGTAARWGRPT
eukprot:CAMPEP_0172821638 /NCGR_PEP_ID=MMETSP1075-20121228/16113_1 /TAXON_ID=2916 /ORGANISM="Ceratium fusus, Strain PA161109" /LENGTH=31 /DNA_ID= /DNA_START= /DNA_END= /DNA_ORIENTATION=